MQRLTVAFKASIGIPGVDGKNYPEKLDHFRIVAKNEKGDWVEDPVITGKLQEAYTREVQTEQGPRRTKLREFDLVFLRDPAKVQLEDGTFTWDLGPVFRTELAWWTAAERKCSGNGLRAMRSITALPEKQRAEYPGLRVVPWTPCGDECQQNKSGECKPTGVLSFIFKDHPVMGSVAQFKTTSYETIARIGSSLMQIADATGGRLRGIPFKAVLRPGKTRYEDKDGKKKSGTAYFVNIEFREEDYKKLVPSLIAESANYSRAIGSAKLLTEHVDEILDVNEGSEADLGKEMTAEFFPDNREPKKPETIQDDGLEKACAVFALNAAQRDAMLNVFKGDVGEAVLWLTKFNALAQQHHKNSLQVRDLFSRALLQPGAMEQMFAPAPEVQPTAAPKKGRSVKAETKADAGSPTTMTASQDTPAQAPPANAVNWQEF